jgi:BirA family biotin operon repressor/biotin-[acetyl-CoA-carboxylase] ligase
VSPSLSARLAATTRFQRLHHVATCSSTQDLAAADTDLAWSMFWAEHQDSGRGRQQRPWHDEQGLDLAVTFSLRVDLPDVVALPVVLPLCVVDAVAPELGDRASELRFKWPNDVLHGGKKLAGVLVDADAQKPMRFRIGIGINVNSEAPPAHLADIATSLRAVTGRAHDREAVLLALAQRLDAAVAALQRGETAAYEERFAQCLSLLGCRVRVRCGSVVSGVLEAIDLRGLRLDGGRTFALAQVQELRGE